MAAKIKDIAKALNISISTVSYALNGGPINVHEDVRKKVLEKAQELGYRPNRIARSLASGRTMTLGVVSFVMSDGIVRSPYFQGCLGGIVDGAKSLDYDILLYTHDAEDPDRLVDLMTDGRVDGLLVIAPYLDSPVLSRVADGKIPITLIGGAADSGIPAFNCDNKGGIQLAIQHLRERGHTRIAHIVGSLTMNDGAERREAFCAAMGADLRQDWVVGHSFATEMGYESALFLLANPDRPTAIVCASDELAAGVYRAAWELGLRIPEDISIVGFDDSTIAGVILPHLTSIRQPLHNMGTAATHALVNLVRHQPVSSQVFQTEIVIRQSTAPASVGHSSCKEKHLH